MLVHKMLEYSASQTPDKIAVKEEKKELTYSQFSSQINSFSAHLSEASITKGDRVAILLPNCIEFCIAYFAILKLGAIVVPLNNRLAPKEFTFIVNDSAPKALVLGYQFWETFLRFKDNLKTQPYLVFAGDESKAEAAFFQDWICSETAVADDPVEINPEDDACIMYTSGTTGLPKGAVMSHRNIFINARNCGAHLGYRKSDITLISVPLFHVTGFNTQLVALLYVGGTAVIMRSYTTAELIRQLAEYHITTIITVPTMYNLMLINEKLKEYDLTRLRSLAYGGAPMDPNTIRSLQDRFNVDLYNCYGLTETSSLTTVMPANDTLRKSNAVGIPVSEVRLRIVDPFDNELPTHTIGELLVKGPNVIKRYWNNPEATAKNIADGWIRTGDFAHMDDEGFVYIADRKKDMINRGGENIYSIEVETAILSHPKALEAAVVPRKHAIFGEVVHAFVVPIPGCSMTEEDIIGHCKSNIADYKVPESVTFLSEMPRNPGGKVLKNKLKEMVPPVVPVKKI